MDKDIELYEDYLRIYFPVSETNKSILEDDEPQKSDKE
jgi:hypothetical protein